MLFDLDDTWNIFDMLSSKITFLLTNVFFSPRGGHFRVILPTMTTIGLNIKKFTNQKQIMETKLQLQN